MSDIRFALVMAEAALEKAKGMIDYSHPKFNWGASFLDAKAIRLLNETPSEIDRALEYVRDALKAEKVQ